MTLRQTIQNLLKSSTELWNVYEIMEETGVGPLGAVKNECEEIYDTGVLIRKFAKKEGRRLPYYGWKANLKGGK